MNKRKIRDILVFGGALFSVFFGGGNLIFPAYIGEKSGTSWVVGLVCFAFAATGGDTVADVPVAVALSAAFMGALSFARLFNLDRGDSLIGGFMGLLGWAAVLLGWEMGLSTFFAFFIGSAAVTMASEILARVRRCPVTVFLVTSIIPMVPGGLLYMTMRAAVARAWSRFLGRGLEATMTAAAIAAGIIAVTALADVYYGIRRSPRRS